MDTVFGFQPPEQRDKRCRGTCWKSLKGELSSWLHWRWPDKTQITSFKGFQKRLQKEGQEAGRRDIFITLFPRAQERFSLLGYESEELFDVCYSTYVNKGRRSNSGEPISRHKLNYAVAVSRVVRCASRFSGPTYFRRWASMGVASLHHGGGATAIHCGWKSLYILLRLFISKVGDKTLVLNLKDFSSVCQLCVTLFYPLSTSLPPLLWALSPFLFSQD